MPLNVEEVEKNAMPKSPEPGYYDNSESVLQTPGVMFVSMACVWTCCGGCGCC